MLVVDNPDEFFNWAKTDSYNQGNIEELDKALLGIHNKYPSVTKIRNNPTKVWVIWRSESRRCACFYTYGCQKEFKCDWKGPRDAPEEIKCYMTKPHDEDDETEGHNNHE